MMKCHAADDEVKACVQRERHLRVEQDGLDVGQPLGLHFLFEDIEHPRGGIGPSHTANEGLQGEREKASATPEIEHVNVVREVDLTRDLVRHGSGQLRSPRLLVPGGRGLIETIGIGHGIAPIRGPKVDGERASRT